MLTEQLQRKAFDAVTGALPFAVDSNKVTVEPGFSYTRSPIKAHDYAAGIMAAYGCVVERLGVMRGLPAQTMTLNRRRCGLLLNSGQMQFLNGYGMLMDTWPIGPDNGTYRTKDGQLHHDHRIASASSRWAARIFPVSEFRQGDSGFGGEKRRPTDRGRTCGPESSGWDRAKRAGVAQPSAGRDDGEAGDVRT